MMEPFTELEREEKVNIYLGRKKIKSLILDMLTLTLFSGIRFESCVGSWINKFRIRKKRQETYIWELLAYRFI